MILLLLIGFTLSFVFLSDISIKRIFQGVYKGFGKHFTQYNSCRIFFFLSNAKRRLFIWNLLYSFWTDERKYFGVLKRWVIFFWWISIEKWVHWFRMAVNVQDKRNRTVPIDLVKKLFNVIDLRVDLFSGDSPYSIEIDST